MANSFQFAPNTIDKSLGFADTFLKKSLEVLQNNKGHDVGAILLLILLLSIYNMVL